MNLKYSDKSKIKNILVYPLIKHRDTCYVYFTECRVNGIAIVASVPTDDAS